MLIQEFYSNMHGFDFSVPHFLTHIRGTHITVTPQIVANVLRVPKVEFPDYPGCERLRTVSKDELKFAFCEYPSDWGERQFTYCLAFAKGPRFLNMVMSFVLHPFSHYNSITQPRARFLLSLMEHITIDFSFHFILSIIDVYRDRHLVISSSSLRLSQGSYAIFLFPFPFSSTSTSCLPLTPLPLNGARHCFIRGDLVRKFLPLL